MVRAESHPPDLGAGAARDREVGLPPEVGSEKGAIAASVAGSLAKLHQVLV